MRCPGVPCGRGGWLQRHDRRLPRLEWGAQLADGRQVHLLSAYDVGTGIVLAQVQIAAKSNEVSRSHSCCAWSPPSWER
jgi:hypothetical protein